MTRTRSSQSGTGSHSYKGKPQQTVSTNVSNSRGKEKKKDKLKTAKGDVILSNSSMKRTDTKVDQALKHNAMVKIFHEEREAAGEDHNVRRSGRKRALSSKLQNMEVLLSPRKYVRKGMNMTTPVRQHASVGDRSEAEIMESRSSRSPRARGKPEVTATQNAKIRAIESGLNDQHKCVKPTEVASSCGEQVGHRTAIDSDRERVSSRPSTASGSRSRVTYVRTRTPTTDSKEERGMGRAGGHPGSVTMDTPNTTDEGNLLCCGPQGSRGADCTAEGPDTGEGESDNIPLNPQSPAGVGRGATSGMGRGEGLSGSSGSVEEIVPVSSDGQSILKAVVSGRNVVESPGDVIKAAAPADTRVDVSKPKRDADCQDGWIRSTIFNMDTNQVEVVVLERRPSDRRSPPPGERGSRDNSGPSQDDEAPEADPETPPGSNPESASEGTPQWLTQAPQEKPRPDNQPVVGMAARSTGPAWEASDPGPDVGAEDKNSTIELITLDATDDLPNVKRVNLKEHDGSIEVHVAASSSQQQLADPAKSVKVLAVGGRGDQSFSLNKPLGSKTLIVQGGTIVQLEVTQPTEASQDKPATPSKVRIVKSSVKPDSREEGAGDSGYKVSHDGRLHCTKCAYSTDKRANWYKHKKIHHGENQDGRRYQCAQCAYQATTSSNLVRHMHIHDNVKKFVCQLCPVRFRQKIHLERHMYFKHQPDKMLKCKYCDFACAGATSELKEHVSTHHPGEREATLTAVRECAQCGFSTASKRDFKQHDKFHQMGPELKLFCETCSFVTDCSSRLKRHLLTHTKERPYACGLCNYSAKQKEHVIRHMKAKHGCLIAPARPRRSKSRDSERHRAQQPENGVGDGGGEEDGEEGGLGGVRDSLLMEASSLPAGRRKIPHVDYRSQEKNFACNFCTMKFTKLINLFKHVHIQHSDVVGPPGDEQFSCVVCDYRTRCKKNLLVHMRKTHVSSDGLDTPQRQLYICVLCNYSNPYRLYLHAHMKKEHNMQLVSDKEGVNKFVLDSSKDSSILLQMAAEEEQAQRPGSIIRSRGDVTSAGSASSSSSTCSADSLKYGLSGLPPVGVGGPGALSPGGLGGGGGDQGLRTVLLQLKPGGPLTPVTVATGSSPPDTESDLQGDYASMVDEAAESLAMGVEPDPLDGHHVNGGEGGDAPQGGLDGVAALQGLADPPATYTIQVRDVGPPERVGGVLPATEAVVGEVVMELGGEGKPQGIGEESRQQLGLDLSKDLKVDEAVAASELLEDGASTHVQLTQGDLVQINGQVYQIEMNADRAGENH